MGNRRETPSSHRPAHRLPEEIPLRAGLPTPEQTFGTRPELEDCSRTRSFDLRHVRLLPPPHCPERPRDPPLMEPFPQPSHYIPQQRIQTPLGIVGEQKEAVALHRCAQERPRGTSRPDPGNRSGAQVPHSLLTHRGRAMTCNAPAYHSDCGS